jgi:hypothetical protein
MKETVELNVSKERLIEPKPQGVHRYRVLFLGGSTTEAIYVPQPQRWVALLNEPGFLAAYNAGQSGANTIDEYFTFKYLTAQGMKFDLVVLTTGINDMPWLEYFEGMATVLLLKSTRRGFATTMPMKLSRSRPRSTRRECGARFISSRLKRLRVLGGRST